MSEQIPGSFLRATFDLLPLSARALAQTPVIESPELAAVVYREHVQGEDTADGTNTTVGM